MSVSRCFPLERTMPTCFCCARPSAGSRSRSWAYPRMRCSGFRISWDMCARNSLLAAVGALGFILGIAELARARRDELLQPLAVAAELGHVVHLGDDADGPTAVIGDDRHGEERPHGLAVLSEKAFLDGVRRDVEQAPELHLVGPEVVRVRDVAQPSCAELLGGPPEDAAERAVHPEELSVEREEGLPDRAVLEGGLELPVGGGHPHAARQQYALLRVYLTGRSCYAFWHRDRARLPDGTSSRANCLAYRRAPRQTSSTGPTPSPPQSRFRGAAAME